MKRSYTVSETHYAAQWVAPGDNDDNFNIRGSVNELAIRYALLEDGPEREAVSLDLVETFDPYFKKHLNMIIRGQLPHPKSRMGKDAADLLRNLFKKGVKADYGMLAKTCKSLHLAFKGMTTDEIYDTLVWCFLRACRKYDPHYTDKVREICEVMNGDGFPLQFTVEAIRKAVDFDALGAVRLLVRKGYLVGVPGPKNKVIGYQRGPQWPPDAAFFESGPIGFTYFACMWFRWYLAEYIVEKMGELESKEGVLQLGHKPPKQLPSAGEPSATGHTDRSDALPHAFGNLIDQHGNAWAADTDLMEAQFDVGEMTDAWVRETNDRLFRNLTRSERWILQMVYRKEFSWMQIAAMLQCNTQTVRKKYLAIMRYLSGRAGVKETAVPVSLEPTPVTTAEEGQEKNMDLQKLSTAFALAHFRAIHADTPSAEKLMYHKIAQAIWEGVGPAPVPANLNEVAASGVREKIIVKNGEATLHVHDGEKWEWTAAEKLPMTELDIRSWLEHWPLEDARVARTLLSAAAAPAESQAA